jgi:hypothetical protein
VCHLPPGTGDGHLQEDPAHINQVGHSIFTEKKIELSLSDIILKNFMKLKEGQPTKKQSDDKLCLSS